MAETTYTYLISTGTVNAKADAGRIKFEYEASAVVIALDHIDIGLTGADNIDVVTKDALSVGDKTILDALIAAHEGVPLDTEPAYDSDGYLITTPARTTHDNIQAVRSISYNPDADPFRQGFSFTITDNNGPNILDIHIDPSTMIGPDGYVQLLGGRVWAPTDAVEDDTYDVVVVDKDGVIPDIVDGAHASLMAHYGMPVDGSFALEVSDKFIDKGQLDIGYLHGTGMAPGGNFEVLGGLYLRLIYNATKGTAYTSKCRMNAHWAKLP